MRKVRRYSLTLPEISIPTPLLLALCACGGELSIPGDDASSSSSTSAGVCENVALGFEAGDPDGHPDPFGAKAANQARAGRLQAADVKQPAHSRQKVEAGDFVLVNDKIAVVIEDKDVSDGYGRFGGEILTLDRVTDDGKLSGHSFFGETLQATSLYQINPTSVTVMNDGSDGNAAVVRVVGPLEGIPFLIETFAALFPAQFEGLDAVTDYSLAPGEERLLVSFGFVNASEYELDTGLKSAGSSDILGFFQGSFNQLFTSTAGFGKPIAETDFVGFVNDEISFAYLGADGAQLEYGGIDISGFTAYNGTGMTVGPCSQAIVPTREIVVGTVGTGINGLRDVLRRVYGQPAWREVTGVVTDANGVGIEGALVHALAADDTYLSRVRTGAGGVYSIFVPEQEVLLTPQLRGYTAAGETNAPGTSTTDLSFDPNGFIQVTASELGGSSTIPTRTQVIPTVAVPAIDERFGVQDEVNGRLYQEFDLDGSVLLPVPVGEHRVIVSHGFEYELHDEVVTVAAGQTVTVSAALERTVDTTGALSADFHIHSAFSADSSDPVDYKIRGALADGVEVPATSEHEWINPWQPRIEAFGVQDWAFSVTSQELTTFTWGHFGVVPITPRPDRVNNGAIDWLDKPAQTIFDEVHALPESPALIVNHPSGNTAFSAYFTRVKLDRATGSSTDPLWSESFDAIEVFNDSDFESNRDASVADWFSLLNAGKNFWSVGSSDSHYLRTSAVGYPRTYLFMGYDDPKLTTESDVRDSVVGGNMTIAGGLFMTVEGPNGSLPGDTEAKTASADFTVTVRCPSWIDATSLEIIVNGETVGEEALLPAGAGPGKVFVNQVSVNLPAGPRAWVLFHAKGAGDLGPVLPGRSPFAVSNPILFQ